ncbi:adenosine receptor A2a-like [Oculina patagonica]
MNRSNISTDEDCSLPLGHGIALMMVNSLGAMLGTFGNILVCIAVLYSSPRLRRSSNFLLVSLAIADLIVTMVCEPLVVAIVGKRALVHDCASSLELAYAVFANLSCSASVLNLAAISVDRFLAVIYPLRHGRIMKNYGLKAMLVIVWSSAVIFTSVRVPFLKETSYLVVVVFVVSYGLIIASYASIVISLVREKQRKNKLRARPTVEVNSKIERRVAFTLAIVIVVFSACWFPMIIVFFAAGKSLVKMHSTAYMWIRSLTLSNSAMNFIIYSARIRDFRDAFALICRKILHCA